MLDDLKFIHQRDSQDALGVVEKQWQQLQYDFSGVDTSNLDFSKVDNIVVGGMGGSALAASLFTSCPGLSKPLEICRNYNLPDYVDKNSLFIASSYSGNTEETLAALAEAEQRGCQIAVIAADGQLDKIAHDKGYAFFQLPDGYQPRMAVFFNFAALFQLFSKGGLSEGQTEELHAAAKWLGEQAASLLPTVPASKNPAKQLAQELMGNSIVIYGGPKFFPVAYKWKINFNENAKNVAWCNQLPEFNHNEFIGWSSHPIDKPYKVVDLRSPLEHPQVQKRFEVSERLLSGRRPAPEVVVPEGDSLLKQLLWTVQLGDFVSLYLALLNGLDPTPVDLIEKLKTALRD